MFEGAGFKIEQKKYNQFVESETVQAFHKELLELKTIQINPMDLDAFQWLIRAKKQ